jgi:hypothetical protein
MPGFKKLLTISLTSLLLVSSFAGNFAFAEAASDQTASVTVPAQASNFPLSIEQITPASSFSQNQEIEYKITYGSDLSFSIADLKIEAQWYTGNSGDGSTQDVADYIVGSATDAYANTHPVVDVTNKKIDWTISTFPANTIGQTVSFKLKTNTSYTKNYNVTFDVAARIYGPGVTTPDSTVTTTYKYESPPTTPTPTPGPGGATNSSFAIDKIEVRSISENSAVIYVNANNESKFTIRYGKTPSLGQSVGINYYTQEAFLTLNKLNPETVYYFNVTAINRSSGAATSDLFTFTTSSAPPPEVNTGSLVATSNDSIISLTPGQLGENARIILVVPESTSFKFRFTIIKNQSNVNSVQAFLRNKKILGLIFPSHALSDNPISNLVELSPGVWEGSITTSRVTGNYDFYARIKDTKGNIIEQKIAEVKVVNKFTVLNTKGKPIEGARILFYVYSPTSKKYVRIPSNDVPGANPQFTNNKGKLVLTLPQGKYKADVSQVGYSDQTVFFDINSESGFPTVKMQSHSITPLALIIFYGKTVNDVFLYNTQLYAQVLTGSVRFFDLVAAIILGSFAVLTLVAFSRRHRIPFSSLSSYFYYLIDHNGNQNNYVEGVVYDEKGQPITGANVYLNDSESEEIVARSKTNKRGEFFFRRNASDKNKYLLLVMCKNYKTTSLIPYEAKTHIHLKITLEKAHEGLGLLDKLEKVFSEGLGMSFEALAILSLIFEILFIVNFGIIKTLPFLLISVLNLLMWTLYIRHHQHFPD